MDVRGWTVKAAMCGLVLVVVLLLGIVPASPRHEAGGRIYEATQGLEAATGTETSRNWAGYILPVAGVTDVEGSWSVPAVPFTREDRASGTWVGIGGANTDDLIQAGTTQESSGGQPQYSLWYELLPDLPQQLQVNVKPGDTVHVSIQQTAPDLWLIHAQDLSNGQIDSRVVHYHSSLSSGEWIEEAPSSLSGDIEPLANFGAVQFSDASARTGSVLLDLSQAVAITMSDQGTSLATVSPTTVSSFDAIFSAAR